MDSINIKTYTHSQRTGRDMNLDMKYLSQPPAKWTFEQDKLKKWVESYCIGRVLNLFAGKIRLAVNEFRVDKSNEFSPNWCGDAFEFIKNTDMKFDTIVLDPPYNLRKAREKYEGRYVGSLTKIKNKLDNIITDKGRVISFGYDTVGMGNIRGYAKIAICVVCHNGDHNDTLGLVEDKISWTLSIEANP